MVDYRLAAIAGKGIRKQGYSRIARVYGIVAQYERLELEKCD
jgi:hypothetical protein